MELSRYGVKSIKINYGNFVKAKKMLFTIFRNDYFFIYVLLPIVTILSCSVARDPLCVCVCVKVVHSITILVILNTCTIFFVHSEDSFELIQAKCRIV